MFKHLGQLATVHPWKVCAAWLAAAVVLACVAPDWDSNTQDDDVRFLPQRFASVRGFQILEQAFPQEVFASRAIFALERSDRKLNAADFSLVDRMVADLEQLRRNEPGLQIGQIVSCREPHVGNRLISEDGRCTLIQVSLATPYLAKQTQVAVDRAEARLQQCLAEAGPLPPRLLTTGAAGIGRDLTRAAVESLDKTTIATVVLVVVVLLLLYRAPLLALVPLATIALSVGVALNLLSLVTLIPGVHLVTVSRVFAIVILYGAGIDYCLFLIARYREELQGGKDTSTGVASAVRRVGGGLVASAATVICGLGMMGFAEFAKVRCAGPAIAVGLLVTLFASLTLAPAVLHLLGPRVFWPHGLPTRQARASGLWEAVSQLVVARPRLVWAVSVLLLAPLAVFGMMVEPTYRPTGELPRTSSSVKGLEVLQRYFPAGEVGPLSVLLTSTEDWDRPTGRELIAHLSQGFAHLDNVAEVRSLTQPLGKPLPTTADFGGSKLFSGILKVLGKEATGVLDLARKRACEFYLSSIPSKAGPRSVTRIDIVLRTDPFDPRSIPTLELIETWLQEAVPAWKGMAADLHAECYGITVQSRDLAQVVEADRVRVNWLVVFGIFAILVALVRRPWLAVYLLVTVLFSYLATLGATSLAVAFFSGRPLGQMDWRVPFFLFTILAAVGQDYNILLVSRILQERNRYGLKVGTQRGLAFTGGTISACGAIMAGTFATLMLSGLGSAIQIGFALAFGVLLDTFVVRPFMVPAFMLIAWRKNQTPKQRRKPAETLEPDVRPFPPPSRRPKVA